MEKQCWVTHESVHFEARDLMGDDALSNPESLIAQVVARNLSFINDRMNLRIADFDSGGDAGHGERSRLQLLSKLGVQKMGY